jgi:DNA-directed RNA polymerase subunit RPC12/RpoP
MPSLAEVVRRYGAAYLARFGDAVPRVHRAVLGAIGACRTGELGTVVYACSRCGHRHRTGQSCGNRHCPTCQHHKTLQWLERQQQRLLPCPYFLLTFTLPAELRRFVRQHQRRCYAALFRASSSAIQSLAAHPKWVGTPQPGFFGVLHTWSRTLEYHPHLHYVVPGGGPSADGSVWMPSRPDFFVPDPALSRVYRARFRDAMRAAGLLGQIDPAVWKKDWVVKTVAVGDGRAALKYLSAYVFRVAIGDHRILDCEDGVTVHEVASRAGEQPPQQ